MSELDKILDEETKASELGRDAEPTPATKVSRPNRNKSKVFSLRLSESELAALQEVADKANLAASTMARSLIVSQLPTLEFETRANLAAMQEVAQKLASSMPPPATFKALADELTRQMEPVQQRLDELHRALAESFANVERPAVAGTKARSTRLRRRSSSAKSKKRAEAKP